MERVQTSIARRQRYVSSNGHELLLDTPQVTLQVDIYRRNDCMDRVFIIETLVAIAFRDLHFKALASVLEVFVITHKTYM